MKRSIHTGIVLFIVVCSYLNNSLHAQQITGVEILPEYPTNADEIRFVVSASFTFLDCRLDSLHPYYACGAFAFDGFYGSSFDMGSCERTDTVILGQLPNGFYPLTYRMYYLGWSQVDQVDTIITVGAVGTGERTAEEPIIKIWPNPSSGMVNMDIAEGTERLLIHSSDGRLVKTAELSDNESGQIALSLPSGLYICTPIRDGLALPARRFIVREN